MSIFDLNLMRKNGGWRFWRHRSDGISIITIYVFALLTFSFISSVESSLTDWLAGWLALDCMVLCIVCVSVGMKMTILFFRFRCFSAGNALNKLIDIKWRNTILNNWLKR